MGGVEAGADWQRRLAGQLGLVTKRQAIRLGLHERAIRRRVATGDWEEVYPGVFRLATATVTWRQRVLAAGLWAEREFLFSHRCAAIVWGFGRPPEAVVELTVGRNLRAYGEVVVYRTPRLQAGTRRDGFPVTPAAQTLLGLCSTERPEDVFANVDEALRRRWTTVKLLEASVEAARGCRGVEVLRHKVKTLLGGQRPTQSQLEAKIAELLDRAKVGTVDRQVEVYSGGRRRRFDLLVRGTVVAIECESFEWHSSNAAFERDQARTSSLSADGHCVLHWTWRRMTHEPEALVAELRRALTVHARRALAG